MGSTTKTVQAPTPTAPSPQDSVNAWVNALPQVYAQQMQYMPQMAAEQQSIQQQLYPQTSGLQENLAGQAAQGMQSGVPSWMTDQYKSDMNAQLGNNAMSGIGADYMSRGLMQQQQNWKQYYQNLGLSLAGRQPLVQPNLDYMSGFTPSGVMQGQNNNYATAGNIYGSQLGYNEAQNRNLMDWIGGGVGMLAGGAQSAQQGFAIGAP